MNNRYEAFKQQVEEEKMRISNYKFFELRKYYGDKYESPYKKYQNKIKSLNLDSSMLSYFCSQYYFLIFKLRFNKT